MQRLRLSYDLVLILGLMMIQTLSACKTSSRLSTGTSELAADGANWSLNNMSDDTFQAIKSACNDPMGASDVGISVEECYLVMAGSAVRESSWNAQKSCEAWGNAGDPCCGLTQSRRGDARAVGLSCDPQGRNAPGYTCNVLTGLRNIGCKASQGADCKKYSSDGSLYTGVRKHLGSNTGALSSYVQGMKDIYQRSDLHSKFGISPDALRAWDEVFYKTRGTTTPSSSTKQNSDTKAPTSGQSQAQSVQTSPGRGVVGFTSPAANAVISPADLTQSAPASNAAAAATPSADSGATGDVWVDAYSKATFPYCGPTAIDPDGDGWGWENLKSCKVKRN